MSDHAHDHDHDTHSHDHGEHADHSHGHDAHGHDAHGHGGHGGHDEHGHDAHGHDEHWGDYNSQPLPPSNLPAVSPLLLLAFGTALTFLLCMIVASSFMLAQSPEHHPDHAAPEAAGESHD